jgi:hypothetical protein
VNKGPNQSPPAAARATDCADQRLLFQDLGSRQVVAEFTAGDLSSDGGVLLLRQVDHGLGLSRALAGCFHDARDARYVDHSVPQLLAQRLYGLALGYEDLNDHAFLRRDPLLATACDKLDPLGRDRFNPALPRHGPGGALHAQPAGTLEQQSHALPQAGPRSSGG